MRKIWLFLTALWLFPIAVLAHPHAFIEMKTTPLVESNQLKGFSVQWLLDEASSAEMLYDLRLVGHDPKAVQKMADDVIGNVISEHYFSYLYDNKGNKIKYTSKPVNYGLKAQGNQLLYYFDFFLAQPQNLAENKFTLMIYDPTYYVSMFYPEKSAVDFSQVSSNCKGDLLDQNVDEKTKNYAASLDKSQREADFSLGELFSQKVVIECN